MRADLRRHRGDCFATAVAKLPGGIGRDDVDPTLALVAEFSGPQGIAKLELEFYGREPGVLRTAPGWFPVALISESADSLRVRIDETSRVGPHDLDRRIVERAAAILATEAVWDRRDDRVRLLSVRSA